MVTLRLKSLKTDIQICWRTFYEWAIHDNEICLSRIHRRRHPSNHLPHNYMQNNHNNNHGDHKLKAKPSSELRDYSFSINFYMNQQDILFHEFCKLSFIRIYPTFHFFKAKFFQILNVFDFRHDKIVRSLLNQEGPSPLTHPSLFLIFKKIYF